MSDPVDVFVTKWQAATGIERANYQLFLTELTELLDVPRPQPAAGSEATYGFERKVHVIYDTGESAKNFIDLYKADCFVLEAKQFSDGSVKRGTPGWARQMQKAYGQARRYATNLRGPKVPFLITVDIGHMFEVWSDFSRDGAWPGYDGGQRFPIVALRDRDVRERLRAIFLDPMSLDPALHAAKVTREVAARLALLSRSLEAKGHHADRVADFVMRCLFTMFAEDVGLLDRKLFEHRIRSEWLPNPHQFPSGLAALWKAMDKGGPYWGANLKQFNGRLFRNADVIALDAEQLDLLLTAAECDWSGVEPAIFGTLLERALSDVERSRLGAHFTPRSYIERLVRATLIDPLRDEWNIVQAAVHGLLAEVPDEATSLPKDVAAEATRAIEQFHSRLCQLRVLDPACGTGNFLYVSFALLKDLESEVLAAKARLTVGGELQVRAELSAAQVLPKQFLGLEKNARAVPIAEMVLWIGYIQWWRRQWADVPVPEPILRAYDNVQARDAVLVWDREVLVRDEHGAPKTVWDMRTLVEDPITGRDVPDEHARVSVYAYENARPAEWPDADYIVGNPPFLGNKVMRQALGDGYAEALRAAWPSVPGSADLVMYWWEHAAALVRAGKVRRFGFITTNSITQALNRPVVEAHLRAKADPLALVWAVPDHPWVDSGTGAAVRIAMTVACRAADAPAQAVHVVVTGERPGGEDDTRVVTTRSTAVARIHADLSAGADVAGCKRLRANQGVSFQGMNLVGQGFRLTPEEVIAAGFDLDALPPVLRPYKNARDLTQGGPPRYVIDFYGLTADEARDRWPTLYERLLLTVKPEREQNKRAAYRDRWWIFGESRGGMRHASAGFLRIIITPETGKHRFFTLAFASLCPDHSLYAIALQTAADLAILSGRWHTIWSLVAGSRMGVGNDPRYRNGPCFETFPFPVPSDDQRARLDALGERLDAHRKAVEVLGKAHLTAQYNALARHREARAGGPALTDQERAEHERLRTGLLAELHDGIDAVVAEAYGWPADLPDADVLTRLVALNVERAAEEARGLVRWLRPDLQVPTEAPTPELGLVATAADEEDDDVRIAWPPEDRKDPQAATRAQLRAILGVVRSGAGPWSVEAVARAFSGARRAKVQAHLEALEHHGVLDASGVGDARRWWTAPLD